MITPWSRRASRPSDPRGRGHSTSVAPAGAGRARGNPEDLPNQNFRPNLKKRGAIRSIFDGKYKFNRYFSPLEHHVPKTIEQLYGHNDLELFDLVSDPLEMINLALDTKAHGELVEVMNNKLNLLIEQEVGEDAGQMLPSMQETDWKLSPSLRNLRL